MSYRLYYHPLSSYSWKALIALYELDVPFEGVIVDETTHAEFVKVWPIGKFPVLVDLGNGEAMPESTSLIEYVDRRHGGGGLIPSEPDAAWRVRLWDRLFDLHIHSHMQRIVSDRIRPAGEKDPHGLADANARLTTAYGVAAEQLAGKAWACGDTFSLADCAAAPALYYANRLLPLGEGVLSAYLERLQGRPSFAQVLEEAAPYLHMFPSE